MIYISHNGRLILICFLESPKDYLETKKRILALREKYGEDNWLRNHAGTSVQDIMGLQSTSQPAFGIQILADVNTISSFYDTLICTMDNELPSVETEEDSQKIVEHSENIQECQNDEEILLDESVETNNTISSMATFDLSEGKMNNSLKIIYDTINDIKFEFLHFFSIFYLRSWRSIYHQKKKKWE